jgi:hypothetical protein
MTGEEIEYRAVERPESREAGIDVSYLILIVAISVVAVLIAVILIRRKRGRTMAVEEAPSEASLPAAEPPKTSSVPSKEVKPPSPARPPEPPSPSCEKTDAEKIDWLAPSEKKSDEDVEVWEDVEIESTSDNESEEWLDEY